MGNKVSTATNRDQRCNFNAETTVGRCAGGQDSAAPPKTADFGEFRGGFGSEQVFVKTVMTRGYECIATIQQAPRIHHFHHGRTTPDESAGVP